MTDRLHTHTYRQLDQNDGGDRAAAMAVIWRQAPPFTLTTIRSGGWALKYNDKIAVRKRQHRSASVVVVATTVAFLLITIFPSAVLIRMPFKVLVTLVTSEHIILPA